MALREAAKRLGIETKGATVAIQGFGNVGSHAGLCAEELLGCKVVGVQDHTGGVYNENGLDTKALADYVAKHGGVKGFPESTKDLTREELFALDVDFLIPAALENQITEENQHLIKAKILVEAANGPTVAAASKKLWERGVFLVPDILANAGGVTVSYFEWVQNLQNFYWSLEEVNTRLERLMVQAFDGIYEQHKELKIDMRTSAYVMAIRRIAEAMKLRGWA